MAAGKLRNRVLLQRLVQRSGVPGETLISWTVIAAIWAEIRDLTGREWYEAQQLPEGDVTTDIIIRYRADVTRQMRVTHGADIYDIVAVLDRDGRREWLTLKCREVAP